MKGGSWDGLRSGSYFRGMSAEYRSRRGPSSLFSLLGYCGCARIPGGTVGVWRGGHQSPLLGTRQ